MWLKIFPFKRDSAHSWFGNWDMNVSMQNLFNRSEAKEIFDNLVWMWYLVRDSLAKPYTHPATIEPRLLRPLKTKKLVQLI